MPPRTDWIEADNRELQAAGLARSRRVMRSMPDGFCEVDGRRLIDFASNDYLNLSHDRRLIDAGTAVMAECGVGARASALVTGRSEWHARLEAKIAEFEGTEAAILFPTGFAANLGAVCALADADDVVFCERLNHASLVDGCRLSGARFRVFRRDRLERLEVELQKSGGYSRRLIVVDSFFSMDGQAAPLGELCDLAARYDALLLADEAHATGIFGELGRGICELQDVEGRVDIRVGTLSKALGCLGGFVSGSQQLIDWLWNQARPQFFSTALPPAVCAAAIAAFDIVRDEPWRRTELLDKSASFRQMLADASVNVTDQSVGPIIPIVVDPPNAALAASEALAEQGFLVPAIRPPTVPHGTSRLRVSLSHAHQEAAIATLAEAIAETLKSTRAAIA